MGMPAFFVEVVPEVSAAVRLDREESHHALAVLRLRPGADIRLLDGRGSLARARVIGTGRAVVECTVLERDSQPPGSPRIHLASALPKGDRQNVLLDMATQLGMASFTPLACARSVSTASSSAYARWARVCRSAAKQALCRYLPELRVATHPVEFVRTLSAGGALVYLADIVGLRLARIDSPVTEIGLVVGPEGGWSDDERARILGAGARPLRLSTSILRVETAAIAGLAVLQCLRGTD